MEPHGGCGLHQPKKDTMPHPHPPRPAPEAYAPPRLKVYGCLRELTLRNGGTKGMNDGGAGNDKTGF